MAKAKKTITVQGNEITLLLKKAGDYISLTDMARNFEGDPRDHLRNWLRNGSTIEFLGVWEKVHNPDFNVVGFHHIKTEFTRNTFLMSVTKWIENTDAIGINLEAINAELIRQGLSQDERVVRLNEAAITQMRSILASSSMSKLPPPDKQ